jgi:Holliday junction resolvase RusA-like endonuclease
MQGIKFTIPLEPTGQMRPRFSRRGKFVTTHKAEKQETRESKMLFYIQQAAPEEPFSGPVMLKIVALMKRPKSHFRTGRFSDQLKPSAPFWFTGTPDLDNIEKMLCDCCNGLVFKDDKQVCMSTTEKRYVRPGERPRWEVEIREMSDNA